MCAAVLYASEKWKKVKKWEVDCPFSICRPSGLGGLSGTECGVCGVEEGLSGQWAVGSGHSLFSSYFSNPSPCPLLSLQNGGGFCTPHLYILRWRNFNVSTIS